VVALEPIIEVQNVSYSYGGEIVALENVSIKVPKGSVTVILGPNGSGKTTLLLICAGLLRPQKGKVLFEGEDIFTSSRNVRSEIGIVFQDPDDQLFNLTVYEEISFGLKQLGFSREAIRKRVEEIARKLAIMHLLNRNPFKLSYGEKKLVVLASILATNPEVLILDEPTANLSNYYREKITEIIREYKKVEKTTIIATHDEIFGLENADHLYLLNSGRIVAGGSVVDILREPDILEEVGMSHPKKILEKLRRILNIVDT